MSKLSADMAKMDKIRNFVKYNWWLFSVGIWIAALAPFYVWYDLKEDNAYIKSLIKKDIMSVVISSPDGRVETLSKNSVNIDSPEFKNHLLHIGKQFIFSKSNLTNGFIFKPIKPKDLYKNISMVKRLGKTYLANQKTLLRFLKIYYKSITTDVLSEYASLLDSEIINFAFIPSKNDEKFNKNPKWKITLKYKVALNYWIKEKNKTEEREDFYKVTLYGLSNPLKYSSINNPYGIKFYNLSIDIPAKRIGNEK